MLGYIWFVFGLFYFGFVGFGWFCLAVIYKTLVGKVWYGWSNIFVFFGILDVL